MTKIADILNEFTKAEIIDWISQEAHFMVRPPRRSYLLHLRWLNQSAELQRKQEEHTAKLAQISSSMKERDKLAVRYNDSQDLDEKIELLRYIKTYDDAFAEWMKKDEALQKKEAALEKLYASIDAALEKEREGMNDRR